VNTQNEPYPDYGCSYQTNFAAMVKNPDDFERPRTMRPTYAAGKMSTVGAYQSGAWTNPNGVTNIGDVFD
jgi:pilus biogenesis lipoprotein CpaD